MKPLKIAFICTALSACSVQSDEIEWRPYKDIDGSIQHISFAMVEQIAVQGEKVEKHRIPTAYLAKPFGEMKVKSELGEVQLLSRGKDSPMATIFLLAGKSLNIHQPENNKMLAQAKAFDFYEFGEMRLSHAQFSAKKAICSDFNGKNGVDLLMTTNYYPRNSFTDFYTALINVKLQRNQSPKEVGYTPSFTGSHLKLQSEIRQTEQNQGKALALRNINEKASILFNLICQ